MLGVTRQAIQARAQRGSLVAYKVGGVWRIPNEVALALVRAERERAVSSGHVRALRPATQQPEEVPGWGGDDAVTELQARVERLEAASAQREREFTEVALARERVLAIQEAEVVRLRKDRQRLRAALRDLLGEED